MSTANDFLFSVSQQKALISSDLNSTLLYQFLFGIYTGLFPATMYIYVNKGNRTRAKDMIIIGTTTALYFTTALNTLINWLYTNILFGTHGATRVEMFLESANQDIPLGEEIINDLTLFVAFLFADSLLVWRCFHSCGRSLRRSLLPIVLLAVETVLVITVTVYHFLIDTNPNFETNQTDEIYNRLAAATLVTVAATSLVSTFVICLQIWRHTLHSSWSRKRYRTIIKALVESSALYTVAVLFEAISQFTLTGKVEGSLTVLLILNFVDVALLIISGLAPTLMIARLFVSSGQEDIEVSSARLPSDLISCASHVTGANTTNFGADLEMQQSRSIGVEEQESEEIQDVPRSEYYGQREDDRGV